MNFGVNTGPMGPQRDTAPAAFASVTGTDADIVTYWTMWCANIAARTEAVLATRGTSSELIEAVLDEAQHWPHQQHARIEAAAAQNPATPTHHAEGWLRGEESSVATNAARNPAYFTVAAGLRNRLDPYVASHVLANPAATSDYLAAHWAEGTRYAAVNPNLGTDDVARLLRRFWATSDNATVEVYSNPNLDADDHRAGLTKRIEIVRVCATANPNTTDDQLLARRDDISRVASFARRVQLRRAYRRNPLESTVSYATEVHAGRVHPELITAVAALEPSTRDAAHSLLANNFVGTIAELFDVAAGITATQHP